MSKVHFALSTAAVFCFQLLAFWTVDAALLCCWFMRCLTQGPTQYPKPTIKMVQDMRGPVDPRLIADYVDIKLVDAITKGIGSMLYFPSIVLLLLVLAYNSVTYGWIWPVSWYVVAMLHFAVAVSSILVLQKTARSARDRTLESLDSMIHNARFAKAYTQKDHREAGFEEANEMVSEVRQLRGGAFVGLVGNPVVGATLLPILGGVLVALLKLWVQ